MEERDIVTNLEHPNSSVTNARLGHDIHLLR